MMEDRYNTSIWYLESSVKRVGSAPSSVYIMTSELVIRATTSFSATYPVDTLLGTTQKLDKILVLPYRRIHFGGSGTLLS